jgi:hypothetical protein
VQTARERFLEEKRHDCQNLSGIDHGAVRSGGLDRLLPDMSHDRGTGRPMISNPRYLAAQFGNAATARRARRPAILAAYLAVVACFLTNKLQDMSDASIFYGRAAPRAFNT